MTVKFQKMHGAGNDFVLLDLREQSFFLDSEVVTRLADRHTGIGFDQMLVLNEAQNPHCLAAFDVWNADGSHAEQCGNGVRCIGLYLYERGETPDGRFNLQGPVSEIVLEALANGQFRVNMGFPDFKTDFLPSGPAGATGRVVLPDPAGDLDLGIVSMGNPHAVLLVEDVHQADVDRLGLMISKNPIFPKGCNAGFVEIVDRNTIRLRVYERGAGETRACGSGACAAASVLIRGGKLDRKVVVKQLGGTLTVAWESQDDPVLMTGPAVHLYEGKLR